jgi:glycosyltransferase involved in cell wall biosynthesis
MSRLSLNFYRDTHKTLSWLERHLFHRRVDIAIGNSEKILDELVEEGVPRERVRLLYNGVDPAPFAKDEGDRAAAREALDLEQDAFVILAVGNLHAYKGHRDLIEACSRASGSLPDRWHLLIAGRDEAGNKAVYVALAEKLGLADRVSLLGSVDNVPQLLFAGDVFVQPSHHEGLPNAVLEAMAASLPVIGTDVGGIPEVVNPAGSAEETGWLVPPHDIASLTAALLQAAANPDRLTSMGRSARRRVESEFSLDESVSAYEAIYRELMVSVGR